jgi:DNA polymerase sigma
VIQISRVLHARIPVISIADTLTETHLDLSLWHIDKLHISEIFTVYMDLDPRIRPLIYCVRKFSKAHRINDAYGGYVNSFGWTVAIVCYLMTLKLVPIVDIDSPPDLKQTFVRADHEHPTPVGELMMGFFEWILNWDYKNTRLSMRNGGICPKEPEKFEDYTFVCIERPRTPFQNITRQVEKKQWTQVRSYLSNALQKMKKGARVCEIFE